MTAFEPPDFSFVGLQFNKDIFENPLTDTSTSGPVPDPLPINELDTNNIQAKTLSSPVTLYTNFNDAITLGGNLVTFLNIISSAFITTESLLFAMNGASKQIQNIFSITNVIQTTHFADELNTSTPSATLTVSSTGTSTSNQGIYALNAGQLQAPNQIEAIIPSSSVNLFTTHTNTLQLGSVLTNLFTRAVNTLIQFDVFTRRAFSKFQKIVQTFPTTTNYSETFFIDNTNPSIETCTVSVNPSATTPTTSNTGSYSIEGGTLLTPNDIQANTGGSPLNLFTGHNDIINFGGDLVTSIVMTAKGGFSSIISYCQSFTVYSDDALRRFIVSLTTGLNTVRLLFYADATNSSILTAGFYVSPSLLTPTLSSRGLVECRSGSFYIGNLASASLNRQLQFLLETAGQIKQVFYADSSNTTVKSAEVIVSPSTTTPTVNNTGIMDFNAGNINLVSELITTIGYTIVHYADTFTLRSNTSNQSIEQTFPSSTTQRQSFFVDDVNNTTETCRISVATGATPLVNNTGTMTLTAGTVSLTADTTNLCNTGASSVVNCNAQLVPNYAYNLTTGVLNTNAIGYTKFGTPSGTAGITTGSNVTRSSITISDDGIYLVNATQAISCTFTGTIAFFTSYIAVLNGAGIFQTNLGVASITALTPISSGNVFYLPFSSVYIVIGATTLAPFTFNFILGSSFTGGTFTTSNANFRYSITRLA
jgi:hypothetical protein